MTRPAIILQGLLVVPLLCFGLIVASPSAGAEEPSNPTATAAPPAADDSLGTDETTTTDPDEIVAGTTCEKPNLRKIEPCLNPNTTAQTWVKEIWQWSLQVVNIFAALVLIFMAFANILYPWRALEQYRIRQLLPTFIWGVILANLSLFICRAVVSVADLLMSNGAFGFNVGDIYTNVFNIDAAALDKGVVPAFFQDNVSNNPFVLLGQILVATFFIYLPIIALAILAFIFYLRFAVILFLSAISPLAFGAIIFPITRQYLSRWWDTLWKWTFGGVGSYLLILIAVKIGQASNIQNTSSAAGFTLNIIPFAIGLILVVLAIQAPFKMGGALAATWAGLGRTGLSMGIRGTKFAGTKTAEGVDRGLKIGASKWLLGAQSLEDKTKKDGGTGAFAWMNKVAANRFHGLVFRREQLEEARKARAAGHDFTISQAAGKSYIRQRRLKQFVGKNSIKALYADHEEYASKWVSPDEAATAIKDIQGNSQWLNKINKEERIAIMTKNVDGIDKMRKRLRNENGITVSENEAARAGTSLKHFQRLRILATREGVEDDLVGDAMKVAAGETLPKKQKGGGPAGQTQGLSRGRGRGNADVAQGGTAAAAPGAGGAQAYGVVAAPGPTGPPPPTPFGGQAAAVRPVLSDANVQTAAQAARGGPRLFARRPAPAAGNPLLPGQSTAFGTAPQPLPTVAGPHGAARGAIPVQGLSQLRPTVAATTINDLPTVSVKPDIKILRPEGLKPFQIPVVPKFTAAGAPAAAAVTVPQATGGPEVTIVGQPATIKILRPAAAAEPPPTPKIIEQLRAAQPAPTGSAASVPTAAPAAPPPIANPAVPTGSAATRTETIIREVTQPAITAGLDTLAGTVDNLADQVSQLRTPGPGVVQPSGSSKGEIGKLASEIRQARTEARQNTNRTVGATNVIGSQMARQTAGATPRTPKDLQEQIRYYRQAAQTAQQERQRAVQALNTADDGETPTSAPQAAPPASPPPADS